MVDALILGIVQGIAEWLPISSSGHLVIFQQVFRLQGGITFDVFLHISSLLVILIYFRRDVFSVGKAFFRWEKGTDDFNLAVGVLAATAVTAVIGLALKKYDYLFENTVVVGAGLIWTAALLFLSDCPVAGWRDALRRVRLCGHEGPWPSTSTDTPLSWKKAVIVGALQGIALIPGISRSGSTIAGARLTGVNGNDAFRFSFLLAIPAIAGAVLMKIDEISRIDPMVLAVGFLVSFGLSFPALGLLKRMVLKNRLSWFAWYCLALSLVCFAVR